MTLIGTMGPKAHGLLHELIAQYVKKRYSVSGPKGMGVCEWMGGRECGCVSGWVGGREGV